MKKFLLWRSGLLALLFALASLWPSVASAEPPEVVPKVDLARYLGDWYEIAAYPQWFQKGCTATLANYSMRADQSLRVLNRCKLQDPKSGKEKEAEGIAWVVDSQSNAKLKVQFFLSSWFRADFLAGDYWIIALGEDYQYAVVSDPTKEYLWILARQPILAEATLEAILKNLQAQGYDLEKLQYTKH
ncbi:MAG: lipocalin family protein [bacterium]|nr:lipocalin family protein [bacterium]